MRKLSILAICLLMSASVASAQMKSNKTEPGATKSKHSASAPMKGKTTWHCGGADKQQQYDAEDGRSYAVAQGTCTATSSTMGEKSGQYTQTEEIQGDITKSVGSFVVTTEDGDKIFYTYDEKVNTAKKTGANNYKIKGGTGKHANAKASGACTGKFNDDDSSEWTCTTGGA